jgi:subtilisin family serine protease
LDAEYFSLCTGDDERLEGHWCDWVKNEAEPVDEHGHGTALVTLLLRVVPNAEIFVARVAKNAQGLQDAEENIAKVTVLRIKAILLFTDNIQAIIHAAEKWDVDIVSMSFGFPTEVQSIKDAIRMAEVIKKESIVFFAAAANEGANTQEMFPASMQSVISVRGTNSNGSFVSPYDPPPAPMNEDSRLYGTLGENVPYDLANEHLCKSGCSLATPIMAGITALIMQYVAYKSTSFQDGEYIQKQIRTRRGVVQLFKEIAVNKGNQRYYVAPWDLFEREEENRLSIIRTAIGKLPRQKLRK